MGEPQGGLEGASGYRGRLPRTQDRKYNARMRKCPSPPSSLTLRCEGQGSARERRERKRERESGNEREREGKGRK